MINLKKKRKFNVYNIFIKQNVLFKNRFLFMLRIYSQAEIICIYLNKNIIIYIVYYIQILLRTNNTLYEILFTFVHIYILLLHINYILHVLFKLNWI